MCPSPRRHSKLFDLNTDIMASKQSDETKQLRIKFGCLKRCVAAPFFPCSLCVCPVTPARLPPPRCFRRAHACGAPWLE
jgi:hypothetical protein